MVETVGDDLIAYIADEVPAEALVPAAGGEPGSRWRRCGVPTHRHEKDEDERSNSASQLVMTGLAREPAVADGPGASSRAAHLRRLLVGRGASLLATTALTAIAAVLVTWPLIRHMGSATLASGEVLLTAWQLNWFQHALLSDPLAWVDANIFFPYENASTLNDLLLTHAVITLPAVWVDSPVLALNLALLGGIVLCGVFAHLLILELTSSRGAAVVGGVLFALAPYRFLHLGHLSIAASWAIPLFFWSLLRHMREPSRGRAALASLSGVAVGLSSLYHAVYVAPIVPVVLLFGARRGPGGRRVWLPLLVAALPGLAVLAGFFAPYATALDSFGVAAAPSDLLRYGADLSSLGQKPAFLGGANDDAAINDEARLYPGAALALLAFAGAAVAVWSVRTLHGWRRRWAWAFLGLAGVTALGVLLPLPGLLGEAWRMSALALIWASPLAVVVWAIAETRGQEAIGPMVAIRLGLAGAFATYVLALGPEARFMTQTLGTAPYWLLAQASVAFEGARAPARFGGLVVLFLALLAAGVVATLAAGRKERLRLAGLSVTVAALLACLAEVPVPGLPEGREIHELPDLSEPAYEWIRERPGRFGILELPDWPSASAPHYEQRTWRALRYMLASKQHHQHLVNGTARTEPFLWRRFRRVDRWSDEYLEFIRAYFPVRFVLVHEEGLPPSGRDAVRAWLDQPTTGWDEVFRSPGTRVYTVDRSTGQGVFVDRLYLRRGIAPLARVAFSVRLRSGARSSTGGEPASGTLELLRDGDLVETWPITPTWRPLQAEVPIDATAPRDHGGWPGAAVLLRWRLRGEEEPGFELRGLSVEGSSAPPRPGP